MFGLPQYIDKYAAIGAERVVFGLSPGPADTVHRELDELATAAQLR
jgi:hypothetical protein